MNKRIAVIGAMDEEVQVLKERMENVERVYHDFEFFKGTIEGQEIILLKSGIGKVNAAISTTLLVERFQPDYVINTGSAGGFNKQLNIGDIVVSSEVRYHDVDVTVFDYVYGQVPRMPAAFYPDDHLVQLALRKPDLIEGVKIVCGLITTGDSFMDDPDRVAFVKKKFPDLYAGEMEAAAIAHVCYVFKVPFVIIRSISDVAGEESNISFEQFLETASINSAELVVNIIRGLKDQ